MDMLPRHMTDLLDLYQAGGPEAMDTLMVELCEPGCLSAMQAHRNGGIFVAWSGAFSAAAAAHERGEYELAVPIWLVAIEGVVGDLLQRPRFYAEVRRKALSIKLRTTLAVPNSFVDDFAQAWVAAIKKVAESTPSDPDVLNRNAILHGRVPAIGGRKESVQGMQLLALFSFLYATGRRRRDNEARG